MSGESLQSAPGITAAAVPGRVVHAQKQPPPLSGSSGSLSQSPGRNQVRNRTSGVTLDLSASECRFACKFFLLVVITCTVLLLLTLVIVA